MTPSINEHLQLYSTASDPQPQMIPRPQMIPKMDRKWLRHWLQKRTDYTFLEVSN